MPNINARRVRYFAAAPAAQQQPKLAAGLQIGPGPI
jgi:hypothetical protein